MPHLVDFSREQEVRLAALTKQLADEGKTFFDNPELQSEYEDLTRRNENFLAEGERRLNNASSSPTISLNPQKPLTSMEKVKTGAYFWGSLVGKAVPAYLNSLTGALPNRKTWHFITDQLILGGVPLVTKVGSSGDHLGQLKRQIAEQIDPDTNSMGRYQLGLVAACLTQAELDGFGMPMIEFAQQFHFQAEFGTNVVYAHLPMPDTTSEVSMEAVRKVVDLIHETVSENLEDALATFDDKQNKVPKRCAYIHCKAGVGRSWMVLMCYLTTHGGRSFQNAEQLIRMTRTFVNPSDSQTQFVKDFIKKFDADERAKVLMATTK